MQLQNDIKIGNTVGQKFRMQKQTESVKQKLLFIFLIVS